MVKKNSHQDQLKSSFLIKENEQHQLKKIMQRTSKITNLKAELSTTLKFKTNMPTGT